MAKKGIEVNWPRRSQFARGKEVWQFEPEVTHLQVNHVDLRNFGVEVVVVVVELCQRIVETTSGAVLHLEQSNVCCWTAPWQPWSEATCWSSKKLGGSDTWDSFDFTAYMVKSFLLP